MCQGEWGGSSVYGRAVAALFTHAHGCTPAQMLGVRCWVSGLGGAAVGRSSGRGGVGRLAGLRLGGRLRAVAGSRRAVAGSLLDGSLLRLLHHLVLLQPSGGRSGRGGGRPGLSLSSRKPNQRSSCFAGRPAGPHARRARAPGHACPTRATSARELSPCQLRWPSWPPASQGSRSACCERGAGRLDDESRMTSREKTSSCRRPVNGHIMSRPPAGRAHAPQRSAL